MAAIPLHTYSGQAVYPMAPEANTIAIEDIAHALANLCRFGGHVREFYSVAQHSVIVSHLCAPADALHGLLHDASEAYLVDVPRPVKKLPAMAAYRSVETILQAAIYQRFGLSTKHPESVEAIDDAILVNEARDLFKVVPDWALEREPLPLRGKAIEPWDPTEAKTRFLARFRVLAEGVGSRAVS